jgi:hypothetical protein
MKTNPTDWYFSISDDDDDDFNESWLEKYPDSERPPTISLIHKAMFHKEKERYCDWHISKHVEHFMGPFHEVSENCFKAGYKDVKSSFEERMTKARSYFLSLGMEEFSESFEERNSPEFLASLNDYPREEKVTRELL